MEDRRSLPPLEDDFTRALLRSAEGDEPTHAAYAKVAAALGVGTALGVGASLPAPAALAVGASGAAGLARWSGSLAAKLALLGVSGALLIGAGVALLGHHSASKPKAQVATVPALTAAANLPVAVASVSTTAAQPASLASASAPSRANGGGSTAHGIVHRTLHPGASSTSSLPKQVQSLDRARVALNSGNSGAALVEIAHYRRAWPKGVFLTEASVLEIEALAKRGETSLAAARARAFVAAHPDSPQAERLRALIPADQP